MSDLNGMKILVTGGSRGIGASIVQILAAKGAIVAFTYSSQENAAKEVLSKLPGSGHFFVQMDAKDEDSVIAAVEKVLSQFGQLDGLVNNAGITRDSLLLRLKSNDFDQVIQTNLRGTFLVTKSILKSMLKNKAGSIVNITSVIGQTGNAGQSNYAASKAGIEAFAKSVALEVASRGIRVNCVAPGFISTEMTGTLSEGIKAQIISKIPMGIIADPREVAYTTAFLLSNESTYITGQTLNVNGGLHMG